VYNALPVLVDPGLLLVIPDVKDRLEISMASSFVTVLSQRPVLKSTNFYIMILGPSSRR
jgi:hypothetical protein